MKSITPNERIVHNYKSAPYKSYIDADGREIPGQSYVQFDDTFPEGAGFTLYRMAPGSSSQPHEHTCHEQFFVIEGEVTDNDGYVYKLITLASNAASRSPRRLAQWADGLVPRSAPRKSVAARDHGACARLRHQVTGSRFSPIRLSEYAMRSISGPTPVVVL